MSLEGVNCSLVCCNYQKEQTKCSKNFRITTVVLGILLTGAGVGIAIGVGSFGWALVSAGIVSFMIGTCCFYPKKEQSYRQSRPVQHIERPRNAAHHSLLGKIEEHQGVTETILKRAEEIEKEFEALKQTFNQVDAQIKESRAKKEQESSIIADELDNLSSEIRNYHTNLKLITNEDLHRAQLRLENYLKQLEIIMAKPLIIYPDAESCFEDVTNEIRVLTKKIEQYKQSDEETAESSTTITSAQLPNKTFDPLLESTDIPPHSLKVENKNKSEVTNEEALKKWEEKLSPLCLQIYKFKPSEDSHAKNNLKEYETKIAEFEQLLNQLKKEIEDIPNKQRANELLIKVEGLLKNKKQDVEKLKASKSHTENPIQPTTSPLSQQGNASQNLLSQSKQQIMNPQGHDLVEKSEYQKSVFEDFLIKQASLMEEQRSKWKAKKEQEQQAQLIIAKLRNLHSEIFVYYKSVDIAKEGLQQVESKLEEYKSKFGVIKAKPFNDYDLVKTYSNEVTFVLERLAEKIQTFKQSA